MRDIIYKRRGIEIVIPSPENYRDVYALIRSDALRYGKDSLTGVLSLLLRNQGFAFSFYYRLSCLRGTFYSFARLMKYRIGKKYGIQISHNVKIGWGFFLSHPFGLIVNETAVIGSNVTISQYVTVGAMTRGGAYIGDCVYVGPNSCIVEDIVIGHSSVIGAGAVVVKDVGISCTVGGVPASVISNNDSGKFIINRFEL